MLLHARERREDCTQRAAENISPGEEGQEDGRDPQQFVEQARAAFRAQVALSPIHAADVLQQPLALEHHKEADDDDAETDEPFHIVIVPLFMLVVAFFGPHEK